MDLETLLDEEDRVATVTRNRPHMGGRLRQASKQTKQNAPNGS